MTLPAWPVALFIYLVIGMAVLIAAHAWAAARGFEPPSHAWPVLIDLALLLFWPPVVLIVLLCLASLAYERRDCD